MKRKSFLRLQEKKCLFIFIDKAIHASSLQNSRITISISLHPSIYPVSSPPILVQFNHIKFLFGLIIPFATFLNGGINSISDLKINIFFRDSLTSRIIGKCTVPFNSNSNNSVTQFENSPIQFLESANQISKNDFEASDFSQRIENLPYFFHQYQRFPVFAQKVSKNEGSPNKVELCKIILTVAIGKENDKEKIMPAEISSQGQIRFKRNYKPKSSYSPPFINLRLQDKESDSPLSELRKYSAKYSESDTSIRIDLEKRKNSNNNIDQYKQISSSNNLEKRDFDLDNQTKSISNHKIPITDKSKIKKTSKYQNKKRLFLNIKDTNKENSSQNLTKDQIQFIIANWEKYALQNGWSPPKINKKNENKNFKVSSPTRQQTNKPKFLGLLNRKLIKISPKNANILHDKQDNEKSDNKNNKNNETKLKKAQSDSISQTSSSLKKEKNASQNKKFQSASVGPKKTTQYQLMTEFSLDDDFPDKVQKCFNSDPPPRLPIIDDEYEGTIDENSAKSPVSIIDNDSDFERTTMSSPGFLSTMSPTISNEEQFFSQNDSLKCQSSQFHSRNQTIESNNETKNTFDDATKSSFESLEAMIKVPPINSPIQLKYSITHFDDVFDSPPSVTFGEKEIISVQVFRARPNPSEKLNTIYYSMKSKTSHKKEKVPPPLNLKSLSEPQIPIQKSPSLEKIFQDGFMDSGLNISGIYNDSSSDD